MKCICPLVLLALLVPTCIGAEREDKPKPAQSIEELRQQLEKILKDTHTPGVSVAIVHKDGPEWVTGLGLADVATNRPTTADTLFRIGSTSKAFVSLSVLLLADQGKLSLDDPVHKLVPDVWFENRWEASDPVRVVNLLEHTTGWDDLHLREYAKQAPDSMSLRDGLDYDHHSRTSRWPPGTRSAYCNSGPAVAAHIVEKLTGQRFEDFVQQNLFLPIGMKTATYFEPAPGTTTTLYQNDGKTPYTYWHILLRPAGSINASANDMAAYVQFYLNNGAVAGKEIVSVANIDRMESPTSTWAAKDGMKAGYGLSNYWSVEDGFVYHGHDGGVEGGITEMAYMRDYGVGYFFSINSGNGDAFDKVGKAIRAYLTHKLEKPALPAVAALPLNAADYAGWYEPDSPRVELTHFLERLFGLSRVRFQDGKLVISSAVGRRKEVFFPVAATQFRHVPEKDPPDPVPTMELLSVNPEGRFIQSQQGTMKMISSWMALGEILGTAFVFLSIIAIVVYAPFWILGGISRRRRRPSERALRLWPLLAVISLFAFVGVFQLSSSDLINRLGNLTVWSFSLWALTLIFGLASVAGFLVAWRGGEGVRGGVRKFSLVVSLGLLLAAAYLAYWGVIGVRTWA